MSVVVAQRQTPEALVSAAEVRTGPRVVVRLAVPGIAGRDDVRAVLEVPAHPERRASGREEPTGCRIGAVVAGGVRASSPGEWQQPRGRPVGNGGVRRAALHLA